MANLNGGIDLELLEQFLAQMQAGGPQQGAKPPAGMMPPGAPPSPMGAPSYNNANFPSGGALPNYGFGGPSQMSKMGLTPEAVGSLSEPAPRPQEYTAPLAEMTPPIMPGAGAIGRGLGAAMTAARPAAGPLAAGLGMTALSSGAGMGSESPLQQLYAQQSALAARRDEAVRVRDQEGATGRGPRYQAADAEVRRIESELSGLNAMISDESKRNSPEYQLEMQRKADELAREQKEKEAATPFRERHPAIAGALPYAGYALGLGLPFMAGAKKNLSTFFPGSYPGRVSSGIRRAESAIASGDRNAMALSGSELNNLITAKPSGLSAARDAGAAAFAGGALGAESGIIPDVIDYANLPDGEGRDNALERIGDIQGHAIRIGTGGMLGASGYKAGGILTPSRTPNIPRATALRDFINNPQAPALPAAPMGPPRLHHSNFQPRNRGQFAPGTPKYPKK